MTMATDLNELLGILTDPANYDGFATPADLRDHLRTFHGHAGPGFLAEVEWVADRLSEHHATDQGDYPFVFGFDATASGGIGGGTVSIDVGGLLLTRHVGIRNLTSNRAATGIGAALAVAEALAVAYADVRGQAEGFGLLADPGASRVRTVAATEQVAIHYQDRAVFEGDLNRPLSEPEWEKVVPLLEGYDEWLDDSGATESISFWRQHVLAQARVATECAACGEPMFTDDNEITHHADPKITGTLRVDHDADADHVPYGEPPQA